MVSGSVVADLSCIWVVYSGYHQYRSLEIDQIPYSIGFGMCSKSFAIAFGYCTLTCVDSCPGFFSCGLIESLPCLMTGSCLELILLFGGTGCLFGLHHCLIAFVREANR